MNPRRILTPHEAAEIIDHAVREQALAVLTLQTGAEWCSFKSKFLERDPQRRFIVLDYQETHGRTPPPLTPGQYVGLSFRHKSRKIMCATVIEAKGRYVPDGGQSTAAIRYRWPDTLNELQRRAYYRTLIPAGTHVAASVWLGGVGARSEATRAAGASFQGHALDISCGGTLLELGGAATPSWEDDKTVGVELHLPDGRPPLVVDAYFRGVRSGPANTAQVALQFVGLELSSDGRAVLQRIARCVQKFHRLAQAGDMRATLSRPRGEG